MIPEMKLLARFWRPEAYLDAQHDRDAREIRPQGLETEKHAQGSVRRSAQNGGWRTRFPDRDAGAGAPDAGVAREADAMLRGRRPRRGRRRRTWRPGARLSLDDRIR